MVVVWPASWAPLIVHHQCSGALFFALQLRSAVHVFAVCFEGGKRVQTADVGCMRSRPCSARTSRGARSMEARLARWIQRRSGVKAATTRDEGRGSATAAARRGAQRQRRSIGGGAKGSSEEEQKPQTTGGKRMALTRRTHRMRRAEWRRDERRLDVTWPLRLLRCNARIFCVRV